MSIFNRVKHLKVGKSLFNLSYEKKLTCDMGELIPIMCDMVLPGDIIKLGNRIIVRLQPMVAPVLHEINVYVHYFFLPLRMLWPSVTDQYGDLENGWEAFITGGRDGTLTPTLPTWTHGNGKAAKGTLWDYLGFPIFSGTDQPTGSLPMDFPRRAYARIYNEYFRDEKIQDVIAETNEDILIRNWEKDYFTSALESQQKGTAASIPIVGTTSAVWQAGSVDNATPASPTIAQFSQVASDGKMYVPDATGAANARLFINDNTVDLSTASSVNIADLRYLVQIQKWMERSNRSGNRYPEHLMGHFGTRPSDETLQRPVYIGGSKSPVIVSEVLQTSKTDTSPQGNMAGHGIGVTANYCGKYRVKEYGLIMGIMSIMPRTSYHQGFDRQWLAETKFDFYSPEFAHLSEQAVLKRELYATTISADNNAIFGYQGKFDEHRYKKNLVCGNMRDTFAYWHLARTFSSLPALNDTFLKCVPRKDIFADQSNDCCIVSFANLIKAIRPLPIQSEPGLMDHF